MMMIGWVADYHGDGGPGIAFLTRLTALREVNWDVKTQNVKMRPAIHHESCSSCSVLFGSC